MRNFFDEIEQWVQDEKILVSEGKDREEAWKKCVEDLELRKIVVKEEFQDLEKFFIECWVHQQHQMALIAFFTWWFIFTYTRKFCCKFCSH